jgi:hypothetical protein
MSNGSIVGTWLLVSMTAKSSKGGEFFPYGENPKSMIVYSESGDVAVVLMSSSVRRRYRHLSRNGFLMSCGSARPDKPN